ncbi:MAG: transcription termination/antitermination protein NusG, partial [Gemmatimonadota bacterium]
MRAMRGSGTLAGSRWYACQTRARAEKQVELRLRGVGFESYLPLLLRERQWADRRKRVALPLFPGYVFARFPLTDLHAVLGTPGLATVVRLNGRPTPVREEEIASVRALVEGANATGVLPSPSDDLTPGQEVVVVGGPFEGMRGRLVEERGAARVVVRLAAVRQAVSVEM